MLFSRPVSLARIALACAVAFVFGACYFTPRPCGGPGESCCSSGARCQSGTTCSGSFFATCESCGSAHRACCSSGTPCSSGLSCTGSGTCEACGGTNAPCCGSTCTSGLTCEVRGASRTCVSCGESGEPCCSGSRCAGSLACTDTGLCGSCGSAGDRCCAGGRCASPSHCVGSGVTGLCTICGGPGEPCCSGSTCNDATTACRNSTCQSCGAIREACCAGATCPTAGTCIAGVCTAVAPPDDASTGDASTPDAGIISTACLPGSCDFAGMRCVPFAASICTHACTNDADCGAAGTCYAGQCAPRCRDGNADCDRYGGVCVGAFAPYPMLTTADSPARACVPSCYPTGVTAPTGYPTCAAGSVCDPASGGCITTAPPSLVLGAPCTGSSDCAGVCIGPRTPAGTVTGFVGGYCASLARNPGASAFEPGLPLPSSNCGAGGVALPGRTSSTGDAVFCYAGCSNDCDCRRGYRCDHDPLRRGEAPAPNGACLPIDCTATGDTCPAGSSCLIEGWSTSLRYPVCRVDGTVTELGPNTGCPSTDAGSSTVDASSDASFDAAAGDAP